MHGSKAAARLFILGSLSLLSAASARAVDLGTAEPYNVFVFGDINASSSDIQGQVAAGNDATFVNYGLTNSASDGVTTVVIGNNLNFTNGGVVHGDVAVGGNADLTNVVIEHGSLNVGGTATTHGFSSISGGIHTLGSLPVNFSAAQAEAAHNTANWATYTTNGTTTFNSSGIFLNGTSSTLNVFNLSDSVFTNPTSFNQNFDLTAPTGSTVLVNVSGTTDQFSDFGIFLHGVDRQHVLFNFDQAQTLDISAIGVQGSIYAPFANVDFSNGVINGTLVANSLTGPGQLNSSEFLGNLPSSAQGSHGGGVPVGSVPEPSSLSVLGIGAALLALLFRRNRRRYAVSAA